MSGGWERAAKVELGYSFCPEVTTNDLMSTIAEGNSCNLDRYCICVSWLSVYFLSDSNLYFFHIDFTFVIHLY